MNTEPRTPDPTDQQFEAVIEDASAKHRTELGQRRRWDSARRRTRTEQLRYEIERAREEGGRQ